ncbi:MAG: hypothetical protein ABSG68_15835 [Thermoguttaceae bacterium]|jgi:hypothetical protein
MWLPKDERRLLAGYYSLIGEVAKTKLYCVSALRPLLTCWNSSLKVAEYGDTAQPSRDDSGNAKGMKRWVKKRFNETNRIERANKHLHERGLIALERHQHEHEVVLITLTLDGYDLGGKYAGFLARSGLWFEEYRNHWLWLIVAFFGGAIGAKLLDWVIARVTSGTTP